MRTLIWRFGQVILLSALTVTLTAKSDSRGTLRFERSSEDSLAEFTARGMRYAVEFRADGYTIALRPRRSRHRVPEDHGLRSRAERLFADPTPPWVVSMTLVGANSGAKAGPDEPLRSRSHYLLGTDPRGWRTDIPHYGRLRYEQVYEGVDIEYYGNPLGMEYDFIVSPGADVRQIRMRFAGAESIEIDRRGDLLLQAQDWELRQRRPVIYQLTNGERVEIDGSYSLAPDGLVTLQVSDYRTDIPLAIDPVVDWQRLLGGSGDDLLEAVAIDDDGFVYVAGTMESMDAPVLNPLQDTNAGGASDAYIAKLSPESGDLVFATFLGGGGDRPRCRHRR